MSAVRIRQLARRCAEGADVACWCRGSMRGVIHSEACIAAMLKELRERALEREIKARHQGVLQLSVFDHDVELYCPECGLLDDHSIGCSRGKW